MSRRGVNNGDKRDPAIIISLTQDKMITGTTANETTLQKAKTSTGLKRAREASVEETQLIHPSVEEIPLKQQIQTFVTRSTRNTQQTAEKMNRALKNTKYKPYQDLVGLLALPPAEFDSALLELKRTRWKAQGTVASKLGTLRALARYLTSFVSPALAIHLAYRLRNEQATRQPAWSPGDPKKVVGIALATYLKQKAMENRLGINYALSAVVSWVTGQRIGDFLLLRTANVYRVKTVTGMTLACLIVEGKTVGSTGPYTLHVAANGWMADCMTQALQHAVSRGSAYVFLDGPIQSKIVAQQMVRVAERKIKQLLPPGTDLRGLRRGGLTQMGLCGAAQSDMLLLSRHTNVPSLNIYQAAGLLDTQTAKTQKTLTDTTVAMLEPHREAQGTFCVWPWLDPESMDAVRENRQQ
jgi:hypothetical protein